MNKSEIAERAVRESIEVVNRCKNHRMEPCQVCEYALTKIVERAIAESRGQANDYFSLRKHLNDYESIFYGPHMCPCGDTYIVRRALAQGGQMYRVANYEIHECPKVELGDGEPSSAPPAKGTVPSTIDGIAEWREKYYLTHRIHDAVIDEELFECLMLQSYASQFTGANFLELRSGAAQEVSPPSPEPTCQCDIPNSGLPIVGEGVCCSCEKKI